MAEAAVAEQESTPAGTDGAAAPRSAFVLPDRLVRTIWIWPALLTLLLGVHGSWKAEMWRDELASWSAANRSTGQLLHLLEHVDAVSGAYYLFLHFWISVFGDSITSMRLPSALAMTGAAVFVVLIGRKLFSDWTGFIAGMLFAVVPSVSAYSQQVRGYAFVVLFVAAATWALLRALERPTSWGRWALYAVCVALAGLFHMISLVFLLPHGVIVVLRWRRSRGRWLPLGFAAAAVAAILPLIPLVILGQRQVGRQISWIQPPTLDLVPDFWSGVFGAPLVSAIFLAMAAMPLAWSGNRRKAVEIGMTAALPVAAIYLFSLGTTSYFLDRYLLFTVPAWCVLAAAAITSMRPRVVMALVFLFGTAYLGLGAQQTIRTSTAHEQSDERGAARIIAQGFRPGDGIVPVRGNKSFMMMDSAMKYYLPRQIKPVDIFAAKTQAQSNDLLAKQCPQPSACIGNVSRVWLVIFTDGDDPYAHVPAAEADALKAHFKPTESKQVRQITVTLLERTN